MRIDVTDSLSIRGANMKKIGLVLGSGGMRGMAHIGVLKVLEEEKLPIAFIVGCSIGSLIGALFACGYSARRLKRMAQRLKRSEWIDFVMPRMGLFAGEKMLTVMDKMTRQRNIEATKIPIYIVATDLYKGCEVVIERGNLAEAVRASTAVPGIFAPFAKGDTLYVDGALVNPMPVDAARRLGADIVIGVDLVHGASVPEVQNIFDVILQSIDIVERQLGHAKYEEADVMICPEVGHISQSDFDKAEECIRIGEEAARTHIEEIRRLLTL